MALTKEQARCAMVLNRLGQLILDGHLDAVVLSDDLQLFLDELKSYDAFGTEGQLDPRGDFRDGHWSMQKVQGIDG